MVYDSLRLNSIFLLVFTIFSLSTKFASGNDEMIQDKYVGIPLDQIIEELGQPNESIARIIDKEYSPTPIEPPFFLLFTEEELENSVRIYVTIWDKRKIRIIVWSKLIENSWTAFSSFEYKRSVFRKF
jgi:hypothetical protein